MFTRRRPALLSVVVPAYDVAAYLPGLPGLGARPVRRRSAGPGSRSSSWTTARRTTSGAIAESYAARDPRVRVVHTENRGLGAARNEGLRHVTGDLLAFADSDDVVPPGAYAALLRQLTRTRLGLRDRLGGPAGSPPTTALVEPPWMRRLHRQRMDLVIDDLPEILGDVFAWNKLFRTDFWRDTGLSWPEGVRYEDQPTTTLAYLRARRFGLVPDVVYHWRIRSDGTSITQQRSSMKDLRDRWETKLTSLRSVEEYGAPKVTAVFRDRVLAGDLHRYFAEIPGCDDEWWELLRSGVLSIWGSRSLTHRGLLPATGWSAGWSSRAGATTPRRSWPTRATSAARSTGSRRPRADGSTCPRTSSTCAPSPRPRWRCGTPSGERPPRRVSPVDR